MQGSCLNNIKVSAIMFGSSDYFVSKQASKQAYYIYKKEGRKPFCMCPWGYDKLTLSYPHGHYACIPL